MVKTPAFPFSIWLPEAHVEASWSGSVVLAAFALKFATFASALFVLQHLVRQDAVEAVLFFSIWLSALAIGSSVDIKKLIANFSILHMTATLLFLASTPYADFYPNFSWHHHSIVTGIFFVVVGFVYASSGSRLVRLFLSNRDSVPILLLAILGLFTVSLDLPWTSNVFIELQLVKGLQHALPAMTFLFTIFLSRIYHFSATRHLKTLLCKTRLSSRWGSTVHVLSDDGHFAWLRHISRIIRYYAHWLSNLTP